MMVPFTGDISRIMSPFNVGGAALGRGAHIPCIAVQGFMIGKKAVCLGPAPRPQVSIHVL